MMRRASLPLLALLAAAVLAPVSAAHAQSKASILFSRTYTAADGSSYSSLFRVKPSGENVVPLTTATAGVNYHPGSWSPSGSAVVYEHLRADRPGRSQLFVVDRQGGTPRRITSGPYKHQQPTWGPSGIVAYVSDRGNHNLCLSVVHANGEGQRDVFCPHIENRPSEPMTLSIPRWTADGKSVFLEAAAYTDNLEGIWISHVYRVDVTTGAVAKIAELTLGDQNVLAISPDEEHGIYAYMYLGPDERYWRMRLVDFSTGTLTEVVQGERPQYSRDGSKIAFAWRGQVYVMNADGSDIHAAMVEPDPTAVYAVADWSWDGTRLLVNKAGEDQHMQIVDLSSGTATDVAAGTAAEHGWYHY